MHIGSSDDLGQTLGFVLGLLLVLIASAAITWSLIRLLNARRRHYDPVGCGTSAAAGVAIAVVVWVFGTIVHTAIGYMQGYCYPNLLWILVALLVSVGGSGLGVMIFRDQTESEGDSAS